MGFNRLYGYSILPITVNLQIVGFFLKRGDSKAEHFTVRHICMTF